MLDDSIELFRFAAEAKERVRELVEIGADGVGGFFDGGHDAAGVWAVRRDDPSLATLLKSARDGMPWEKASRIGFDVAEALAACEKAGRFAGALRPDSIRCGERAWIAADDWIAGVAGATPEGTETISPLWCPPKQAEGAAWDATANRYVLGLVIYKMLSGSHPFSGAGLRRALEAAASQEAPPLPDGVASTLPPGLQSLVLRMLHPKEEERPGSAEEVADSLSRFAPRVGARGQGIELVGRVSRGSGTGTGTGTGTVRGTETGDGGRGTGALAPPALPPPATATRATVAPNRRLLGMVLPVVLGVAVAGGALASLEPEKAKKAPPKVSIGSEDALTSKEMSSQDCASCHPKQASEWRRSVMGHAVKSPLFNSLEAVVQEQIGRDFDCPNGAGILRKASPETACRDRKTGLIVTGSGGEHWCVNCHTPPEVIENRMPAWDGRPGGDPRTLHPVRDLISDNAMEGISCQFCHQVHGPVTPRSRGYQGNPGWVSFKTGASFLSRPEDLRGKFGIANSGYDMRPETFLLGRGAVPESALVHQRPSDQTRAYLKSSEFCGSCHDVRLFGTDVLGGAKGEHFKRLRNGYSEWVEWAATEKRKGREPATCQGCHMSTFPGICEPDPGAEGDGTCPDGTRFVAKKPGTLGDGFVAQASLEKTPISTHYFSGVDLPLSREYPDDLLDEAALDGAGIPISAEARRDMLLKASFDFELGKSRLSRGRLELPITIENVGAGHRVPAGFSQEREIWVHLKISDERGRVLYEVGRVDRGDQDLKDKLFLRVNTNPRILDRQGRPEGLFGADISDGPDHPEWSPKPDFGGTNFRGRGLINFQNGFLRCVRCIGVIASDGSCQPGPGQGRTRADRFEDGEYDLDTGQCLSNLSGQNALFETYFPVGALDASRGILKAPDAIIDTRSAPPGVKLTYTYDLDTSGARGPITVEARLLFRAFPPFLIRAFSAYEREMAALGRRPSGPLVDDKMLERLHVVELAKVKETIRP
jgi:hypothetical protein